VDRRGHVEMSRNLFPIACYLLRLEARIGQCLIQCLARA
jgi:hypothetical protein